MTARSDRISSSVSKDLTAELLLGETCGATAESSVELAKSEPTTSEPATSVSSTMPVRRYLMQVPQSLLLARARAEGQAYRRGRESEFEFANPRRQENPRTTE